MPTTFTKIASVTVGSGGASSIDFTSIPSTYTDLVVKLSARRSQAYADTYLRFNNDSGANYSWRQVRGDGSSTSSASGSAQTYALSGNGADRSTYTANTFGSIEIYVPNYAGSNAKSFSVDSVNENNATQADAMLLAGLWSGTSAINRVTLYPDIGYGDFVQYSTATLYGIKNS
jgi:hypothetical protein